MKTFRCVVVGAGGISFAWFPHLKTEKVDVAAVVDLNVELAKVNMAKYGIEAEVSTDLKAMLKKHRPDFVIDLTVPDAHCQVTCTALKLGAHVIGEKPMAASMAQARKMCQVSKATGKLCMVSQSRRWQPNEDVVRRTVATGQLGELTTLNCDFFMGCHFGGFRDEMASPLILDMSIHHFDLARFMTGLDPVAVYAREFNPKGSWYKGDAAATCVFEMSNGAMFLYRANWCAEGCHTTWNGDWRIIGQKGTLLYAGDQPPTGQVVSKKNRDFYLPLKDLKLPKENMKYMTMHGALREMLAFLRTGKKPQTTCEDNIKSLAMVFGAIESSRKGRRVEIRI